MKFPRIVSVEPLPNFRLRIVFEDTATTIVDFTHELESPIMHSIAEAQSFARVRLADDGYSVYWDLNVPTLERPDAASDWLYLQGFSAEARAYYEKLLENTPEWEQATRTFRQHFPNFDRNS
jgi:hypothetical protein